MNLEILKNTLEALDDETLENMLPIDLWDRPELEDDPFIDLVFTLCCKRGLRE